MWSVVGETRYDVRGRLFGIPFRINPWFWLIAAGLGSNAGSLEGIAVWTACVLVSIFVHEYGHALTARAFGGRDIHVLLYSFGGLAYSSPLRARWQRIAQILMGPGAGFLLFGVVYLLLVLLPNERMSPLMQQAFGYLLWINLWWGIFNLLPILPLDGGQLTSQVLAGIRPSDGHRYALYVSMGTIIFFALCAMVSIFFPRWTDALYEPLRFQGGVYQILFLGFLFFGNVMELRMLRGGWGSGADEAREPWEQPEDWWKR